MRTSINATSDRNAIRMYFASVSRIKVNENAWAKRHNVENKKSAHRKSYAYYNIVAHAMLPHTPIQNPGQPNRIGFYLHFLYGLCSCLATSSHIIRFYTYTYRERVLNAEIACFFVYYHAVHLLLLCRSRIICFSLFHWYGIAAFVNCCAVQYNSNGN